jgi:NhaC family Na+:H+ antiporter
MRENLTETEAAVLMDEDVKRPSFGAALATFLSIVVILILGIFKFKVDMHVLLVLGMVVTSVVAKIVGFKWKEIEAAMGKGVFRAMIGMFIFILIGMIIGSWIESGTVPALIYYGMDLLSPKWFLPAGLLICSIASLSTGTSWGTVGLALMGIGVGMGIPAPIVAGMVISGAFFGDKMSPVSDTTNLAAISAEAGLYENIGAMMYTTIPSFIIALIMYTFLGFKYAEGTLDTVQIATIQETIAGEFNISVWVLLPMIVLLTLSVLRVPAIPSMIAGVFTASVISLIFQGSSITEVLNAMNYGYTSDTGVLAVDTLITRGGIQSMMWTFSLAFIALALGGILDELRFLEVLVKKILSRIKRAATLITVTIISGFGANAAMGEAYLSIILNGRLYLNAFEEKGMQHRMLSRCLGEGAALTTGIIPWTTAGAFMAGALGVPTLQYAPYAFLNWINPILSIILSYLGIFILWTKATKNGQRK